MNNDMKMNKRRVLEALEYLDDDIVSGVLKKIKPEKETADPVMTWKTPFKHWRQFVAAAAVLLLLSMASPIINYVVEAVRTFSAAGWGSEEVPYLQFSPDLEPISQELADEINEKFFAHYSGYTYTLEDFYRDLGENAEEVFDIDYRVIRNYDLSSPYLGTIGDYVIFIAFAHTFLDIETKINGYDFEEHTYVYNTETKTMCKLEEAYDKGLLDDADIELLAKRRQAFLEYSKANKDMPIRITEEEYYEYKNQRD